MAITKDVQIAISVARDDDLIAYGAVLRFGEHHKEISACFPTAIYSESVVMMEGTMVALKMVTRPCRITIIACNGHGLLHDFKSNPMDHLRGELSRLQIVHDVSWESNPNNEDVVHSTLIAEKATLAYRSSVELIRPGMGLICRAVDVFCVGLEGRVSVARWVKKRDDGSDLWTVPVDISVV